MAADEARDAKVGDAIAAAQDPESTTTADDAQREMVAESRNAGVTAFNFDPDATPEQKRAQAAAVCLPSKSTPPAPTTLQGSSSCAAIHSAARRGTLLPSLLTIASSANIGYSRGAPTRTPRESRRRRHRHG